MAEYTPKTSAVAVVHPRTIDQDLATVEPSDIYSPSILYTYQTIHITHSDILFISICIKFVRSANSLSGIDMMIYGQVHHCQDFRH